MSKRQHEDVSEGRMDSSAEKDETPSSIPRTDEPVEPPVAPVRQVAPIVVQVDHPVVDPTPMEELELIPVLADEEMVPAPEPQPPQVEQPDQISTEQAEVERALDTGTWTFDEANGKKLEASFMALISVIGNPSGDDKLDSGTSQDATSQDVTKETTEKSADQPTGQTSGGRKVEPMEVSFETIDLIVEEIGNTAAPTDDANMGKEEEKPKEDAVAPAGDAVDKPATSGEAGPSKDEDKPVLEAQSEAASTPAEGSATVAEPLVEGAAGSESIGSFVEQPAGTGSSVEQPAAAESSVEQPAATESSVEQPAAAESSVEQPAAAESSVEQPAAVESSVEQPAGTGSSVEQPAAAESAVEQPAAAGSSVEQPAAAGSNSGSGSAEGEARPRPNTNGVLGAAGRRLNNRGRRQSITGRPATRQAAADQSDEDRQAAVRNHYLRASLRRRTSRRRNNGPGPSNDKDKN